MTIGSGFGLRIFKSKPTQTKLNIYYYYLFVKWWSYLYFYVIFVYLLCVLCSSHTLTETHFDSFFPFSHNPKMVLHTHTHRASSTHRSAPSHTTGSALSQVSFSFYSSQSFLPLTNRFLSRSLISVFFFSQVYVCLILISFL